MDNINKEKQLRKYKTLATGLFVFMAIVFITTTFLQKNYTFGWVGYVRAFSEAAMVGALADWFAVTALFHHPLGLKIPHTNLIQNKKEQIGDNLGSFVVSNFLTPKNIRPYILNLKITPAVSNWLSKEKNQDILVKETSQILLNIVKNLDDTTVVNFISNKANELMKNLKINEITGNGLEFVLEKNYHQKLISTLSTEIKNYVIKNQSVIEELVQKESFAIVPKFVDDYIAKKFTEGLAKYLEEISQENNHTVRQEITKKLYTFANELKESEYWKNELEILKNNFLKKENINKYAQDVWESIKQSIAYELENEHSTLKNYLQKNIAILAENLKTDEKLQHRIDHWVRTTAYKYILKNTHQFGNLISATVGNWEGKELSNKLEMEVGKDLQFIRINGTVVGGLVGLIIYFITDFFI